MYISRFKDVNSVSEANILVEGATVKKVLSFSRCDLVQRCTCSDCGHLTSIAQPPISLASDFAAQYHNAQHNRVFHNLIPASSLSREDVGLQSHNNGT